MSQSKTKTGGGQLSFWTHNKRLLVRAAKHAAKRLGVKMTDSQWRDRVLVAAAKEELARK